MTAPWLTVIGVGEGGYASISPEALMALDHARHVVLVLPLHDDAVDLHRGEVEGERRVTGAITEESVDALQKARARILVVEDNDVNRRVATALLAMCGYRCDLAHDGKQALEMIDRTSYDLVFMDCQMPVMDGYAATTAIRAAERGGDRHLPIVAMTANAMKQDEDRCREVGMDDHVAKPVQHSALKEALARWLPRVGPRVGVGAPDENVTPPT